MKFIALKKVDIHSKKNGKDYVKVPGILEDGNTFDLFLEKSEYLALSFPEQKVLTSSDVKDVFAKFESVDLAFNNLGRVDSVR